MENREISKIENYSDNYMKSTESIREKLTPLKKQYEQNLIKLSENNNEVVNVNECEKYVINIKGQVNAQISKHVNVRNI